MANLITNAVSSNGLTNFVVKNKTTASTTYIDTALRFDAVDSAYLSRTPASAGNRKTWTWSGWVKRGSISTFQALFSAGTSDNERTQLYFDTDNTLKFLRRASATSDGLYDTVATFTDPSSWYHVVCAQDTTEAAAADRIRIYVNGVEQTLTTVSTLFLNIDGHINNNIQHNVGRLITGTNYFDGFLSEVHFVDGQALTPNDFGKYDTTTGQWVVKQYSGTYGTNGFYLEFENSAALGEDTSGNNNDWTPTNLTSTDLIQYTNTSDQYFDNTILLLPFDGTKGSTIQTDLSNLNTTVSFVGDAEISTTQSKFGGSSLSLSGAGRVGFPDAVDYELGADDFTIECFVYPTSYTGNTTNVVSPLSQWQDSQRSWVIYILGSSELRFAYSTTGSDQVNVSASTTVPLNEWSHIAVTRFGSTIRIFLNGTQVGSGNIGTTALANSSANIWVGTTSNGTYANFVGYIDEVRITKGVARYSANFTPPTEAFPTSASISAVSSIRNLVMRITTPFPEAANDPYWNNVTLLASFDGNNGDTSTADKSLAATPITFYGSAQLSDTQSKFGTTSVFFNGSSYLRADNALSTLTSTTDPFVIEFWAYPTELGGTGSSSDDIIGINNFAGDVNVLTLGVAVCRINGVEINTPNLPLDTWTHFVYVYDGSNHRIFFNSVLVYENFDNEFTTAMSDCVFGIGAEFDGSDGTLPGNYYNGYIDELRVTAGNSRYLGNLDVVPIPDSAFTLVGDEYASDVTLLLPFDGTNGDTTTTDQSNASTSITVFNTFQLSNTQAKFGTTSGFFDGSSYLRADDALSTLTSINQNATIELWVYPVLLGSTSDTDDFIGINRTSDGFNLLTFGASTARINNTAYNYSAGSIVTNQWQHVVYQYAAGVHKITVDGVEILKVEDPLDFPFSDCVLGIGAEFDAASGGTPGNYYNGYMDDLRITTDVARYTTNGIVPFVTNPWPTSSPSDPSFDDVTLLLSFEGTNGDTTTTDASSASNAVTFYSNAQISNAQAKFGSTSLYLDGSSYIRSDTALDTMNSVNNPLVCEMWIYPTSVTSSVYLIGFNLAANGFNNALVGLTNVYTNSSSTNYSQSFTTNEWQLLTYICDGTSHRIYRNGVLVGKRDDVLDYPMADCTFAIGAEFDAADGGSPGNYFTGYVDEVRLTSNTTRYLGLFDNVIEPFPTQ